MAHQWMPLRSTSMMPPSSDIRMQGTGGYVVHRPMPVQFAANSYRAALGPARPVPVHGQGFAPAPREARISAPVTNVVQCSPPVLMTPQIRHRDIMASLTPLIGYREIRPVIYSQVPRTPELSRREFAGSPLIGFRQVSPISSTAVLNAGPWTAWRHAAGHPQRLNHVGSVSDWRMERQGDCDPYGIQQALSQIPAGVGNTLGDFIHQVQSGFILPAMCHPQHYIDRGNFWETRRVHNIMRRVLEFIQERYNCYHHNSQEAVSRAFGDIVAWARGTRNYRADALSEAEFTRGFEACHLWPPELTADDKQEVFVALRVPSSLSVKRLTEGHALPSELSRPMFEAGFSRVPYNLPDFPVPKELLANCTAAAAAKEIAHVFGKEQGSMDSVKDFYMTGLLTMEEIQVELPLLLSIRLIEEAVTLIINGASRYFTQHEWNELVFALRADDAPTVPEPDRTLESVDEDAVHLGSSSMELPELSERHPEPHVEEHRGFGTGNAFYAPKALEEAAAGPRWKENRPQVPQSEPILCREVRSEKEVTFSTRFREVNWGSVNSRKNHSRQSGFEVGAEDRSHQADQGAGWGSQDVAPEPKLIRHVSLDLQNECLGPLLAVAFVRCCQLYKARGLDAEDTDTRYP